MTTTNLLLMTIVALGAGLCIVTALALYSDHKNHPWRLLLLTLIVPILPIILAQFMGLRATATSWEPFVVPYLIGLVIAALTVAWKYGRAVSAARRS